MELAATDLRCAYLRRTVLAGVTLAVRPGEVVAILGPNGAGKTTLLRAMARLLRPTAGAVTLGGRDVWAMAARDVAQAVAFAPQVLAPDWPFTVREFVGLGRTPHRGWWRALTADDRRAVDVALGRLGLGHFAGRVVTELSGGEWQRVRLAQALAQEPRVLLLDEPTAHLDPRAQVELLTDVRRVAGEQGTAVAMTLHDLNLPGPWADRVVLLAEGRVVADGPPGEVLAEETLSSVYDVPLAVAPHPRTGAPAVSLARPGAWR